MSNLLLNTFNNINVLGEEVCVEREATLLIIMSHYQHNVGKFLIQIHFFLMLLKYLYIYIYIYHISDGFT